MAVTIRDIARQLGLSHTTVSLVLNDRRDVSLSEETRRRVLEAAAEVGYQAHPVARALSTGRTETIAFWAYDLVLPYYSEVLAHFYAQTWTRQYKIMVACWEDVVTDRPADPLRAWPVDGVVCLDLFGVLDDAFSPDAVPRVPVVSMGHLPSVRFDSVVVDLYSGAQQAMAHLLSRVPGRVAHMTPHGLVSLPEQRRQAYLEAMAAAGRPPETIPVDEPSRPAAHQAIGDHVREHGYPRAIFAHNDDVAIGAYRGLRDLGLRIPEDVALVGCDGIQDTEYLDSPLTTLQWPNEAMCQAAWRLLERRWEDPGAPREEIATQPQLVIRESSYGASSHV